MAAGHRVKRYVNIRIFRVGVSVAVWFLIELVQIRVFHNEGLLICMLCYLLFSYDYEQEESSVEMCLTLVKSKVNKEKVNRFNLNRRRLLECTIRGIDRKGFQEDAGIIVKFSDDIGKAEGAVDAGGPTREFLRLAVAKAVNGSIFEGSDSCKYIGKCDSGELFYTVICVC